MDIGPKWPRKFLAVKIAFRERKLDELPHGRIVEQNGKQVIVITSDPNIKTITPHHCKRYRINSAQGKQYKPLIEEYIKIRNETDELILEWRKYYGDKIPKIKFPITQYYDPHNMDHNFYLNTEGNTGVYRNDNPTRFLGVELKSKNEQLAADVLMQLGIDFKYEPTLRMGNADVINPDFLADFEEIDRASYIEVLGMTERENYSITAARKINAYSTNQYRPGREVIYVMLYDKFTFDLEYVKQQIFAAIESMIPSEALTSI